MEETQDERPSVLNDGLSNGILYAAIEDPCVPINDNDFKDAVEKEGAFFVDKSLMIRELIDSAYPHILITRPRRWGKTLNMSMLSYFFNIEVDENGDTKNRFKYSKLFTNLKIAKKENTPGF
jgi:hypothetical protein